jgi:hypothetical protein
MIWYAGFYGVSKQTVWMLDPERAQRLIDNYVKRQKLAGNGIVRSYESDTIPRGRHIWLKRALDRDGGF